MSEAAWESDARVGPYKVNSLGLAPGVDPVRGTVSWDPARSIWNGGMLLAALVLGPLYFTWSAFGTFLALLAFTMCTGHSVGFHRRLIHRTFQCPKALERVLVWSGTLVGMHGPFWVIRSHDTRDWAQRQRDCHPYLKHGHGLLRDALWNLHCRLVLASPPGFDPGPGIGDDAFYRFLQRTWMLQQLPLALVLFAIGGLPWVVWGVCVRVTVGVSMHWFVGYLCHTHGPQSWIVDQGAVQAHNVPWAAIPSFGESWHNNHHAFPASARHGLYPGELDLGFCFVRLLERWGLAWAVQTPESLPPRPGISPALGREAEPGKGAAPHPQGGGRGGPGGAPWRNSALLKQSQGVSPAHPAAEGSVMRVTVTQMRDRPEEFAADWQRLAQHTKLERSDLVLLPEMPFHPWFAVARVFEPALWQAAVAAHDAWEARLGELGAQHVLGTRPVDFGNQRYNAAFAWNAPEGLRMVHTKAYLPDEEGVWEASWYHRETPDFVPFRIGGVEAGFLICTELWAMEHARGYGQENVSLLLTPRLTGADTLDKWLAAGRVAAVLAGAFGLSANRYDATGRFGGQGWIVSPDGDVLGLTSPERPFITVDLDLELAARSKATYPRYALGPPTLPATGLP